jgi:transmembrane sensor
MHPWHEYLTPDDFLTDDHFRQWVRSGAFTHPADPLTAWLADHPTQQTAARDAIDVLLALHLPHEHDPATDTALADALSQRTWAAIHRQEGRVMPLWVRWRGVGTWAAAAAAVLLVGWLWFRPAPPLPTASVRQTNPATEVINWRTQTNAGATVLLVGLADGSSVWLHPGGQLRYPDRFSARQREVFLTGNAFFEVARNPDQPFLVQTNQLTTRVLGTSFLVKSAGARATVQVRSGRVEVSLRRAETTASRVVLTPNQQVVVATANPVLTATPIRQPDALATRLNAQSFEFSEASLPTILDAIAAAYGLRIDYDRQRFARCVLTTSLTDEPLSEKLNILAATLGPTTRFALSGNQVTLTGDGCP